MTRTSNLQAQDLLPGDLVRVPVWNTLGSQMKWRKVEAVEVDGHRCSVKVEFEAEPRRMDSFAVVQFRSH